MNKILNPEIVLRNILYINNICVYLNSDLLILKPNLDHP